jgi:hypothetical protein
MSLTYSKDAVVKGFSNFEQHNGSFADDVLRTPEERIDEIFTIANRCRGWYEPVFKDQSKYLPVSTNSASSVSVVAQTKPPSKVNDNNDLLKLLLVGAGVFIIIKSLS